MKVQLTHYSYHPAARGMPGDVVDAPEPLAAAWIQSGGAKPVGPLAAAPARATPPQTDDVPSDDEPPAESADDKPQTDESSADEKPKADEAKAETSPKPSRRRR